MALATIYLMNMSVVFDLMRGSDRAPLAVLTERVKDYGFVQPRLLHTGGPFSIEAALVAQARKN